MIGHPVLGDPRYGRGNKNSEGIQLSAVALRFHCPFMKKRVEFCDTGV
jgi:tRNA pseudouridine32 synthase/23S rRNA pseudouridine746 synthase